MTEYATIRVIRYRDPDGNPTCARNFETGEVCTYYRSTGLGTIETCLHANGDGKYRDRMQRRGGEGYLIPLEVCPVWADEKENKDDDQV